MKAKGNIKQGGKIPDFWPNRKQNDIISEEFKEWVTNQYYCQETLTIYCDASIKYDKSIMGVACSYVTNGTIRIKYQYIYPTCDRGNVISWYAEMKGIIFALSNFEKHLGLCSKVIIYSDLKDIDKVIGSSSIFKKNKYLQLVREELKLLYQKKRVTYRERLSLEYLSKEHKRFNPFYKSAHNAASELVRS